MGTRLLVLLAIVNNTTMNVAAHKSAHLLLSLLLSISSEVELLNHMGILFNFLRKYYPVFHRSCPILYPHQECLHTLTDACFTFGSFLVIVTLMGVVSHCCSDLCFPNNLWHWASFHELIGCLCIFFGEMPIQILCLFLNWFLLFCCCCCLVWGVLYIFWILIPY